jgi:hypothetical protein
MVNKQKPMIKKRLITSIIVLSICCSFITFLPLQTLAAPQSIIVSKTDNLTCGELIWVNITDQSLNINTRYYVKLWDGSDWEHLVNKKANEQGNLAVSLHIPYRHPVGSYNLSLWNSLDDSGSQIGDAIPLWINNTYKVEFRVNNQQVSDAMYNKAYAYPEAFSFYVYNWSGTRYDLLKNSIVIKLYDPSGINDLSTTTKTGKWDIDYTFNYTDNANLETSYWLNVTRSDTNEYSNVSIPVKLDVTVTIPSNILWGDTILLTGYVKDGNGDPIKNYSIRLYSPTNSGYRLMASTNTFSTGRFSVSVLTDEGCAGNWYLGTGQTGSYRIDETDILPISGFIQYQSFIVASDESASISLVSPDIIVAEFTQTLNISVRNNWDDEYFDEMWMHVAGLDVVFNGVSYDADEVVVVHANSADSISKNGKYAYYEFDIIFNETGTGTLIVSYPLNYSSYEDQDDLEANLTRSISYQVTSSDEMTMIVENMPTMVLIDKTDCAWKNRSRMITVKLYGNDELDHLNASIVITGCGLDISIDEEDASEYWVSEGIYQIPISPKVAGTLIVIATNKTEDLSVQKDYPIKGLYGLVSTLIGDDKEIVIESSEKIAMTITNGQYAEVHLTYYNKNWVFIRCINETIGDNTNGNGMNGIFEFVINEDDIKEGVGYIVIAANSASDYYMFEVIEVTPNHDLMITLLEPFEGLTQSFTVGLPHDIQIKIVNQQNKPIYDISVATGELYDEAGNILQTFSLRKKSENIWYIDDWIPHFGGTIILSATNNSGGNEHTGNLSLQSEYATITYSLEIATVGIQLKNITIDITGVDANGSPLPKGTKLYLNNNSASDTITKPGIGTSITLKQGGIGSFMITKVGDVDGFINCTLQGAYEDGYSGNTTNGALSLSFPTFDVQPPVVFISKANTVSIIAYDSNHQPIPNLYLTLLPSSSSVLQVQPEPVKTDENGFVTLSISPITSGNMNITIARDVVYVNGQLSWTNAVITDTIVTAASSKFLKIEISKSPIYQGERLTISIKSDNKPVSDVAITFGEGTSITDENGKAVFIVPDPGVESAVYIIQAEKIGFEKAERTITVIKTYGIIIIGPTSADGGSEFSISIIAKGRPLAGATVVFQDKTMLSDANGKVIISAPQEKGTYHIFSSYEGFQNGSMKINVIAAGIPGFEITILIAALLIVGLLLFYFKKK